MTKLQLLALALFLSTSPADAEDVLTCEELMGAATAYYREALFQSDPLHQDGAAANSALAAFRVAWRAVAERAADCAPCRPIQEDEVEQRVQDIADVAEKAELQNDRGRLDQAHLTLSQIRPMLTDLRHAGEPHDYAAPLDAFDDKLSETTDDDLDEEEISPDQFVQLCEQVGVLAYLGEKLEKRAPARWAGEPEFLDALENLSRQVRGLRAAVLRGRHAPIRAALSDLRQSFDRFYRLYG
ncbi:hypothetical protein [Telmatospirillum siberiense]|uniref:Imelysin-like domain-containing protein n=1 Tax=Telmatospirillum siberiense TaxID=382514 RepID=A0A2N3PPH4_9PROT|nr:hypothetical protein [Telmatospirillum siberiense]PKU22315.1 hypothetical protein CWS72_22375 [Telmatospirillum siberiense]